MSENQVLVTEKTYPTNAQAAFISTIVGAGAAWFGLYVGSGHKPASKK